MSHPEQRTDMPKPVRELSTPDKDAYPPLPQTAHKPKPKPEPSGGKWWVRTIIEFAIALALAFLLTWLVTTFVIQPFEVPSGSMEPTIRTGDKIIAEKLTYMANPVARGDIVVFQDITMENRVLVKRVVALPGETVDLRDGRVYVNGEVLYEPYTHSTPSYPLTVQFRNMNITYPYTVPDGHIWVMGDNRTNSADSRYFGPVQLDTVKGRVIAVFWPPESIGLLGANLE